MNRASDDSETRRRLLGSIEHSADTLRALGEQVDRIEAIARLVVETLRADGKILTAGHGGSAADALHMAEELVGRFESDRPALPAIALVADPTLLTCIGNDYGFQRLFPRQVEAHGKPGDVLVIFSTSGNGEGFHLAVDAARRQGVHTVALLGKGGGELAGRADHELIVADRSTARIQEAHTLVLHLILETVEAAFVDPG